MAELIKNGIFKSVNSIAIATIQLRVKKKCNENF